MAKELKVSDQTIRNLCASGQITASRSPGGHYRIAPAELERLKALESLPAVARATISDSVRQGKKNVHELLSPPSAEVIESAEEALVSDCELVTDSNRLQRLKLRRESVELLDFFGNREKRRLARELEEERRETEIAERRRQQREAELAAQERQRFYAKWLAYPVNEKPWDGPEDYALLIRPAVLSTLAEIQPDQDDWTVRLLVDAAIARTLAPWRDAEEKRQANRRAVDRALSNLPLQMRWDKTWEARARQAANEAIDGARDGAARDMAAVAELALRTLVNEFEHERKIQTAVESAILWNGTTEEREAAAESVHKALAVLAVGSSDREIEKAKSSALAPIKNEIRLREAKEELIQVALREIYPYAERLLKKFNYEIFESALMIELRTKNQVEKVLREELSGNEDRAIVVRRVHELMKELENCGD